MFTIENFINGIQASGNILVERQEEKLVLTRVIHDLDSSEDEQIALGEIPLEEINGLCKKLQSGYTYSDSMLWTDSTFEVAVQTHDRMRMPMLRPDRNLYEVAEHHYLFYLSKASAEYLFSVVCNSAINANYELDIRSMGMIHSESILSLEGFFEWFRIFTVKITGSKRHSVSEFKRMLSSYLFNISYNRDITFSVIDFSNNRRALKRRSRRTGQLFPYKFYNQELSTYYHQAIATDIPFAQYLAFYHVAEFFFQVISEQDAFQEIESFITRPSFSPRKKEDIKRFYNMIKRKMREQRDDGVWNETTGLLLCLKKYVPDIGSLKVSIETIDSTAIDYYKTTTVEFADDGKTINFSGDMDAIYNNIRDRVYSVRNAIVHSKEGDRLRYEPFKHDKQLAREIPLIRGVAEEIIVNSAKPIDYNFDD